MHRSRSSFFKRHQSFGMQTPEDSMFKKERNKKLSGRTSREKPTMKRALKAGQLVRGVVQKISDHGAVVDIHGVSGFLHISEISDRWLKHPSEELKVGDSLTLRVISNEIDEKGRFSIRLSCKDLTAKLKPRRKKSAQAGD